MKRYVPFLFLGLIFLLTLLRASAGWASAPKCLEGPGWRRQAIIEGQFLTHIPADVRGPARVRRRRHPAPTAPPKHEGLDKVELWELPNTGPLADPQNRTALLIQGDEGECLVSKISGKGTGRMEIGVVPLSRETDAIQVRTSYWQGTVQQTTQLYVVDKKLMSFQEIWTAITVQQDPVTGKSQESRVEYLDVNADNYTDISLTDSAQKVSLWKWNPGKKRFDHAL